MVHGANFCANVLAVNFVLSVGEIGILGGFFRDKQSSIVHKIMVATTQLNKSTIAAVIAHQKICLGVQ